MRIVKTHENCFLKNHKNHLRIIENQENCVRIMTITWESLKLLENCEDSWNSLRNHENHTRIVKNHKNTQKSSKSLENHWQSLKNHWESRIRLLPLQKSLTKWHTCYNIILFIFLAQCMSIELLLIIHMILMIFSILQIPITFPLGLNHRRRSLQTAFIVQWE